MINVIQTVLIVMGQIQITVQVVMMVSTFIIKSAIVDVLKVRIWIQNKISVKSAIQPVNSVMMVQIKDVWLVNQGYFIIKTLLNALLFVILDFILIQ